MIYRGQNMNELTGFAAKPSVVRHAILHTQSCRKNTLKGRSVFSALALIRENEHPIL